VSPGRLAGEPWRIAPVRVAGIWFSKAHFTHASHTVGVGCKDCHEAAKSTESADLLIPGVENCRGCHAGEGAIDKVPSTCVSCHGYHEASFLVLAELQARAKGTTPARAPSEGAGGARR
jgi:predicted CXXCH cytochrome family protein